MRIKQLDVLRAIAVLLVLGRHVYVHPLLFRISWVGVDLFFVLSGFLISGLLFREYKKHSTIDFPRFFVRRGLKIYPSFYVLILLTVLVGLYFGHRPTLKELLPEVFFFQNYRFGLWGHTWSLAVEEHFYILLPIFLLVLIKFSRNRQDPFAAIPHVGLGLGAMLLMLRLTTPWHYPHYHFALYYPTHLRIDSLFFGVILGYFHHFRPEVIPNLLKSWVNRVGLAVLSALLIAPCFFLNLRQGFMLTFGFTFLYLGFGGVLILTLYCPVAGSGVFRQVTSRVGSVLAYIGTNSYSIYLWHWAVALWGLHALRRMLPFQLGAVSTFFIYVVASLGIGIVMAKLIEFPVLRLRDHFYPAKSAILVQAAGPTQLPGSILTSVSGEGSVSPRPSMVIPGTNASLQINLESESVAKGTLGSSRLPACSPMAR